MGSTQAKTMRLWLTIAAMNVPSFAVLPPRSATGEILTSVAAAAAQSPPNPAAPTGRLHLSFSQRSPLSTLDEVLRRIDASPETTQKVLSERATLDYDLANESFEIFVPPTYKPNVPHGLFIWMGPSDVPPPIWQNIFNRYKLIWVSANVASDRHGYHRYQLPLDAVHNLRKTYNIDGNRVYVGGISAGAGLAVDMVCGFPDVFHGGYFLMGGRFYVTYKAPAGRWHTTIERQTPTWKGPIDQVRKDMRLVLMRGQTDPIFPPAEDRGQCECLALDGFTRTAYIEVPGIGHNVPNAAWFEKGIIALDRTPAKIPPVTRPTTQPAPLPGQIAQAQRLLSTAQRLLDPGNQIVPELRAQAPKYLRQILAEYPTTPAAAKARQLLEGN